jgi:hypothetical protein
MKLRPFESNAGEDHKAALGMLQYRVEQLIDTAQRQKKAPLDRQEKQAIMRNEMAKQVLVGGGPTGSPAGWAARAEARDLARPRRGGQRAGADRPDRAAISDAMRAMYERTKKAAVRADRRQHAPLLPAAADPFRCPHPEHIQWQMITCS